jgi:predicted esterase
LQAQVGERLTPGAIISKVVCKADPQQSYALFLPSHFSPDRQWPIIYAFDPGARGQSAVERIRDAAEKYGYIVAGSNNSRNGPQGRATEAAKAMWEDTQQRFPIHEHRRYFAGMSGGARVATALAWSCNGCVAGVIANAAGFPSGSRLRRPLQFAYFAAVGNADFNYSEFVDLRRQLQENGEPYRIWIFEGGHDWAPPEVWLEALNWMDLQAMRAGLLERDRARIQQNYVAELERAKLLRSQNDLLESFRAYRFAVGDFSGLVDVSAATAAMNELSKDKRLKTAEKQESYAVADQLQLMSDPSAQMHALASGDLKPTDFMALNNALAALVKQTARSERKKDTHALALRRALSGLVIQAFESGQSSLEQKKYSAALLFFDLMVAGSENSGWGHYERARAYAAMADRTHMLAELQLAQGAGFHNRDALDAPEFQAFHDDREFQAMSAGWSTIR